MNNIVLMEIELQLVVGLLEEIMLQCSASLQMCLLLMT